MEHNDKNVQSSNGTCWVCDAQTLRVIKKNDITAPVRSTDFAITDSSYGKTSELSQCSTCEFIQSTSLSDVLSFYENLEDTSYEANRKERLLQAEKIVKSLKRHIPGGRLLDIGAGSGILVEEAKKGGFDAEGIEPSTWLQQQAKELKLPVFLGTFPHKEAVGPYDAITIIDVIEHVNNPVSLLQEAHKVLNKDGIIVVITPDVDSVVARLLQFKWWHFRIAHIGYFNKKNLDRALVRAGFTKVHTESAKWYFALDYLLKRVNTYLPTWFQIPIMKSFSKVTIPLNLHDSVMVVYSK